MRLARVKDDYRLPVVNAHTGKRYVKNEWRPVPDDGHVCDLLDYKEQKETAVSEPEPPSDDSEPTLAVDLDNMLKAELVEMARKAEIPGFHRMKKAELIDALKDD